MIEPDLNLLVALDALLAEGNVSGAAQKLGLSTSAMSRTLARLRAHVGDPLLVPAGRKMVPTPHADAIRDEVRLLCGRVKAVMQPPESADPRDFHRAFTLRANEAFVVAFGAGLVAAAAETAPGVQLRFAPKLEKDIRSLRDGVVDLDIGVLGEETAELKAQTLYRDRFVGIARARHPLLSGGDITPQRYAAAGHVVASRHGKRYGPVDAALADLGLERTVRVVVPSFPAVLAIVAASELIGLVPRTFFRPGQIGRGDGDPIIAEFALPVMTPEIVISQSWHPRLDADPAHRWLRGVVFEACRRMIARRDRVGSERA